MQRRRMSSDPPLDHDVLLEEGARVPIRAWTRGVALEDAARRQLANVARLPIVHGWIAVMPDVHWGIGATVGSVIPTRGAIIPAAVGVDIGCGMMAARTTLAASDLPDDLAELRRAIERAVPHGRTDNGGRGDRGAWHDPPEAQARAWAELEPEFRRIADAHKDIARARHVNHLGTLGTGNHFIEVCLDEAERVWFMLHSGSRGVGNRIGTHFIELAKKDMERHLANLPDKDLAYFEEGAGHFDDYCRAVAWAQRYAMVNRELMMAAVVRAARGTKGVPPFEADALVVNCHHNYVARETHGGAEVWVTRKGAVRAGLGDMGIIPGSMGARSYIVRGRGNPESLESCSHGAGRAMSRGEAKRRFTLDDHAAATSGVECRKDADVLDETPAAYKPIDAVMAAQRNLVDVVHTLKQVVCVKG
ncbi:MAG: RNA-splicing ligase RtcB [Planctomycetes bacterium]|nr:RNA-splicing ligase RtcB [Planctomycetota bacterium]